MSQSFNRVVSVLVVEDSVIVRARLRALLAEDDAVNVVAEAASAAEAIERFRVHVPDAVVLDLQLAGSSGLDVLRHVKQVAPRCTVIMLTNHTEREFREACQKDGADHFFHKSTEFDRVADVLAALSQSHPSPGSDSAPTPSPSQPC
jgi:two-component system, OmpR family, response regulator